MTKISLEENVGADQVKMSQRTSQNVVSVIFSYTVMSSMKKFRLVKTKHDSLVMHKLVHRGQHATHILL